MFSNDGVNLTDDAAGYQTRLEYVLFNSPQRLKSKINYDTGLVYIGANGAEQQMVAVMNHHYYESNSQVLMHTNYRYGTISGNIYTGVTRGCRMGVSNNALMDGSS